jgi:hypothetical protein
MARPKSPPDQYRGAFIRIRVTEKERKKITRLAKQAGAKNDSTWIRDRLLGEA